MKKYLIISFLVIALLLLLSGAVRAAIKADELTWYTVDGGGGTSQGGSYTLRSTIGQPDVGLLTGGDYILNSGFWSKATSLRVYLPMVIH